MAHDMGSWLSSVVLNHDKKHGAHFNTVTRSKGYIQMVQFTTYRTPSDPHAQIKGVMSDKTHYVDVFFDVKATDRFEESIPGLEAESLTSHLRAIFQILAFKIHFHPPTKPTHRPMISFEISDWKVISGDRNEPVFWEDVRAIGGGDGKDQEVEAVLRKWWLGESNSDPSQEDEKPIAGPSRLPIVPLAKKTKSFSRSMSSSSTRSLASSARKTNLKAFIQPFLNNEGKKSKMIPDWIFEVSEENQRELDKISMFGLDWSADPSRKGETGEMTSEIPREERDENIKVGEIILQSEEGAVEDDGIPDEDEIMASPPKGDLTMVEEEYDEMEYDQMDFDESIANLVREAEESEKKRGARKGVEEKGKATPLPTGNLPLDSESEEEEIPLKPLRNPRRKNDIFDPLAFPSPSPAEVESGESKLTEAQRPEPREKRSEPRADSDIRDIEDEDGLSDYEREQRRAMKAKRKSPTLGPCSESLGASQPTQEFGLARYTVNFRSSPASQAPKPDVLVEDSDLSGVLDSQSGLTHDHSQRSEQANSKRQKRTAVAESPVSSPARPLSSPWLGKNGGVVSSPSLGSETKPSSSALSYLNPLNLFKSRPKLTGHAVASPKFNEGKVKAAGSDLLGWRVFGGKGGTMEAADLEEDDEEEEELVEGGVAEMERGRKPSLSNQAQSKVMENEEGTGCDRGKGPLQEELQVQDGRSRADEKQAHRSGSNAGHEESARDSREQRKDGPADALEEKDAGTDEKRNQSLPRPSMDGHSSRSRPRSPSASKSQSQSQAKSKSKSQSQKSKTSAENSLPSPPITSEQSSVHQPSVSISPLRSRNTTREIVPPCVKQETSSQLEPNLKLGGFKPKLRPVDGHSEAWVLEKGRDAVDARRRQEERRAKRK
ncbi:hypothetical protein P7C73_g1389, partial [Tremellales sp. Uapishka_1]